MEPIKSVSPHRSSLKAVLIILILSTFCHSAFARTKRIPRSFFRTWTSDAVSFCPNGAIAATGVSRTRMSKVRKTGMRIRIGTLNARLSPNGKFKEVYRSGVFLGLPCASPIVRGRFATTGNWSIKGKLLITRGTQRITARGVFVPNRRIVTRYAIRNRRLVTQSRTSNGFFSRAVSRRRGKSLDPAERDSARSFDRSVGGLPTVVSPAP